MTTWNKYPETKPEKKGEYLVCSEDKKSHEHDYDVATFEKGTHRKKVYVEEYKGYIDVEIEAMKFRFYDDDDIIAWTEIPKYRES